MGGAWDKKLSDKIRKLSIENMRRLGLVLSDMCYIALNAYEEKKGKPLTSNEITRIMDTELDLIITQNLEDEQWRDMIHKMAEEKYHKQKKSDKIT